MTHLSSSEHDQATERPERRHAVIERRALDRRVRAVIEGMSDAFLALDPAWRVVYANREAGRLNDCTAADLVGCDHWERWPETIGGELERGYRRAMRDRVPIQLAQYYPATGRWHDVRAFPMDDGGLAIFFRDVTVQKSVEAERERQAKALATAHDRALRAELQFRLMVDRVRDYAVFLMDPDGTITHWGEGARRMKGWQTEEIVGRHLEVLYPPGGVAEDGSASEHLRKAAQLGEYSAEGTRVRKGGAHFPAHVTLTALRRDGELVGFSEITQDLTTERQREQVVIAALSAAQSANDAKSQFLANTSHEIRTPLNAVMGYAELLELGLAGPLSDEQRQYLVRIQETSRHLLSLINDVLDLSRIEAGQMRTTPEPAPVRGVAESAMRVIEPQARARRVALLNACSPSAPTAYYADTERVRQILVNLLSNAVRFTEAGGRVTVSCGIADAPPPDAETTHHGGWIFVRVEDTGVGIPAEQVERIWDAFVQVDGARTRKVGGSGLGLTISRHLARLMDGDITVSSEVGFGSSFTLWLPRADEGVTARAGGAGDDVDARTPVGGTAVVGADAPVEAMPDDHASNEAAVAAMQRRSEGLADIAEGLLAESERVLSMYVARLRNDDRIPSARDLSDEALADHEVTYLADLASCLAVAGNDGPDATGMLSDGTAIQRLISARHGAQRARLGWSEAELRRDYEILLEEILSAIRRRVTRGSSPDVDRASQLLATFVRTGERHGLEAFARVRAGASPNDEAPGAGG